MYYDAQSNNIKGDTILRNMLNTDFRPFSHDKTYFFYLSAEFEFTRCTVVGGVQRHTHTQHGFREGRAKDRQATGHCRALIFELHFLSFSKYNYYLRKARFFNAPQRQKPRTEKSLFTFCAPQENTVMCSVFENVGIGSFANTSYHIIEPKNASFPPSLCRLAPRLMAPRNFSF